MESNLIFKAGGFEVRRVGDYKWWEVDCLTSLRDDPKAHLLWRAVQFGKFRLMYWNAWGRMVQRILWKEQIQ